MTAHKPCLTSAEDRERLRAKFALSSVFPSMIDGYPRLMDERPHVHTVMADREAAIATFVALNMPYDG